MLWYENYVDEHGQMPISGLHVTQHTFDGRHIGCIYSQAHSAGRNMTRIGFIATPFDISASVQREAFCDTYLSVHIRYHNLKYSTVAAFIDV